MNAPIDTPSLDRPVSITDVMDLVPRAVGAIAFRLPPHVDRDDLTAAGHLALVQAFDRAPLGEGEGAVRAFLLRRISGAIRDELRRADSVGRRARHILRRLAAAQPKLELSLGRPPALSELATEIGVCIKQVRNAIARAESAQRVPDGEAAMGCVASEEPTPVEMTEKSERLQAVLTLLDDLTPRERIAVVRTILEGHSVEEVAIELSVTVARVHQLRTAGLRRLRDNPKSARLRG